MLDSDIAEFGGDMLYTTRSLTTDIRVVKANIPLSSIQAHLPDLFKDFYANMKNSQYIRGKDLLEMNMENMNLLQAQRLKTDINGNPDEAIELIPIPFIPTYNEPLEVVRQTVFSAMSLDWPKDRLHVYVLDDGRRTEFREFCEELGVGYLIRDNNHHAKAGNINAALQVTHSEYVAIFDCDHIPTRSFLQVCMGWFFKDTNLVMLQTPHVFFSPDPFERNLDKAMWLAGEVETLAQQTVMCLALGGPRLLPGDEIDRGPVTFGGVAWAQNRGVRNVEVRIDSPAGSGVWQPADLGASYTGDTWRLWRFPWRATESGLHTITVRATDNTGTVQTEDTAPPPPDGATGWHQIEFSVR